MTSERQPFIVVEMTLHKKAKVDKFTTTFNGFTGCQCQKVQKLCKAFVNLNRGAQVIAISHRRGGGGGSLFDVEGWGERCQIDYSSIIRASILCRTHVETGSLFDVEGWGDI